MSVSKHVLENFLKPCIAVFGDPPTEDMGTFFEIFDRMLKGFSVEALISGCDTVLRTHKGPARWPKPAVCVDACTAAEEGVAAKALQKPNELSGEAKRQAEAEKRLVGSDIGMRAAKDGWCLGLAEFMTKHNRWPSEYEIGRIIETSRFIDRQIGNTEPIVVHGVDVRKAVNILAASIIERRNKLADKISEDAA